jgi:hypothetical protein
MNLNVRTGIIHSFIHSFIHKVDIYGADRFSFNLKQSDAFVNYKHLKNTYQIVFCHLSMQLKMLVQTHQVLLNLEEINLDLFFFNTLLQPCIIAARRPTKMTTACKTSVQITAFMPP